YARIQEQPLVFTVLKAEVSRIIGRELRDLAVLKFDSTKATGLKLRGWKVPITLELEKKDGKWVNKQDAASDIDSGKVATFLAQLSGLRADRIVSDRPDLEKQEFDANAKKGDLHIEVTFEGEQKPVKLYVGKTEGDGTLVTTDLKAGTVYSVRRALFDGAD